MSAFNIPSDNDTLLNTSPIEISFLLNQPEMPATLTAAFSDQPADTAGICVCMDTPDFADYFSNSNKNYTLNGVKYDF